MRAAVLGAEALKLEIARVGGGSGKRIRSDTVAFVGR